MPSNGTPFLANDSSHNLCHFSIAVVLAIAFPPKFPNKFLICKAAEVVKQAAFIPLTPLAKESEIFCHLSIDSLSLLILARDFSGLRGNALFSIPIE